MRNRTVTHSASQFVPEVTFHALADSTRLAVLERLRDRPQSVGEIAAAFPISRPAISKHLRQLHKAHLVFPVRRGRHRFFQLNPAPLQAVDAWMEQYRQFWSHNLASLKLFVEDQYARETGEVFTQGVGVSSHKTKSKTGDKS